MIVRPHKVQTAQAATRALIPWAPRLCSLLSSATTPLYSTTVCRALQPTLRSWFLALGERLFGLRLSQRRPMYACLLETGGGFFEVVCAPVDRSHVSPDPPSTIREVTHPDASHSNDERGRRLATCPACPIRYRK